MKKIAQRIGQIGLIAMFLGVWSISYSEYRASNTQGIIKTLSSTGTTLSITNGYYFIPDLIVCTGWTGAIVLKQAGATGRGLISHKNDSNIYPITTLINEDMVYSGGLNIAYRVGTGTGDCNISGVEVLYEDYERYRNYSNYLSGTTIDLSSSGASASYRSVNDWMDEVVSSKIWYFSNFILLLIFEYVLGIGALIFGFIYGFRFFKNK